jgi:hypothetical protein
MRRSICVCEPNVALAGVVGHWKFVYTTANHLPKGTKLRFDLDSNGTELEWQLPQTNLKKKENIIWAEAEGKIFGATEVEHPQKKTPCYEFTLPTEVKPGETLTIHLGNLVDGITVKGNLSQKTVQRKRPFILYIDPKGKGDYKESETFYLDVRGNILKNLRIIAPSLVNRNKRFDVIVRFEDMYGNLTSNAPAGTLIELSYEHLRENLNWKLFVPETGFIALPNLYFNEPGIYRIQLQIQKTKELFFSPPIKCLPEAGLSLYWGLLHGESDRMHSSDNIETLLRHMRDDKALQFFATSCFESEEETPNEVWKSIVQQTSEFNEEDRFVALQGFLWQGEPKEEGLRQFIYAKDNKPILRKKDTKNNSLKKIYKTNNPKEMISIPMLTMGKETSFNFEDFNPEFEKVVEIYNAWGSSESLAKDGNKRPISGSRHGISETAEGSMIKALNQGHRFGFVAGGSDHRSIFKDLSENDQTEYSPGLTAILAKEHNRFSLIEALQARSCYATTGERIVVGLQIAGFSMGAEIDTKNRPGLEFNRHLIIYAIGTAPLTEITLIRNGKPLKDFEAKGDHFEIAYDDMDPLSEIVLEPANKNPFVYYYLRVKQKDGHIAWSSPIWVDLTSRSSPLQSGGKKMKKKSN